MAKKKTDKKKAEILAALQEYNVAVKKLGELLNVNGAPVDCTDCLWSRNGDVIRWTYPENEYDGEHAYSADAWGTIIEIYGFTLVYLNHYMGDGNELTMFDNDKKIVEDDEKENE